MRWAGNPVGEGFKTGVLTPTIEDWRVMVDVIMIDTHYDGEIFKIAYSDAPVKKDDLVIGHYELDSSGPATTVAVKIIDVLGEELIVAETV